ncbi:MAG: hypothetical protein SF053_15015 [Bacteroidia bacterium]|nr:hypothetical protein [Bacteroidia bacterium]
MSRLSLIIACCLLACQASVAQPWRSVPSRYPVPASLQAEARADVRQLLAPYHTDATERLTQDTRILLDSSRTYITIAQTGERQPSTLSTYSYDAAGRLVETTTRPGIGYPLTRTRYAYDNEHQLRAFTDTKASSRADWIPYRMIASYLRGDTVSGGETLDWSPERQVWIPVSRTIRENQPGGVEIRTTYQGDTTSLDWTPAQRQETWPDGSINLAWDTLSQDWKITDAQWLTGDTRLEFFLNQFSGTYSANRSRYTYSADNQISKVEFAYAEVTQADIRQPSQISWNASNETRYTYDPTGRRMAVVAYTWIGTIWRFMQGDTTVYDTQGRIQSLTSSIWYDNARYDVYREIYTYDTLGHQQVKTVSGRSPGATEWQYSQRTLSDFDTPDQLRFFQRDYWISNGWEPYDETTYLYDGNSQTTQVRRWIVSTQSWVNSSESTSGRDADGRLLRLDFRQWIDSAWVCNPCFTYVYTPEGDPSLTVATYSTYTSETYYYYQLRDRSDPGPAALACLTANPWQPGSPIQCIGLDPEQVHHLVVSDLQGRVILRQDLVREEPVYLPPTLRSGLYVLAVFDADGKRVAGIKLVVE